MLYEFPDNLNSSQGIAPEKQGNDWHKDVKFLLYFPKSKRYSREEQHITQTIKSIENTYKQKIDEIVSQLLTDEQGTLNIIPKKANIDLKRAIQPKLNKLKKKTERCIVELLNEKFQASAKIDDSKRPPAVEVQNENLIEEVPGYKTDLIYDREVDFDEDFDDYETE